MGIVSRWSIKPKGEWSRNNVGWPKRMRLAEELGAKVLVAKSDSHLVTRQATSFEKFTSIHLPREQNERADLLSKSVSTQKGSFNRTIIQETLS
ncbi:hypothetical protein CR513_10467, partial [Mucuna pruriens]